MSRALTGSISKYTIGKRIKTRNLKSFSRAIAAIRATVKGTPIRNIPPIINQGSSFFKAHRKIFIERIAKTSPSQQATTVITIAGIAVGPWIKYAGKPTKRKIATAQRVIMR